MKLLRNTLVILPGGRDGSSVFVRDPESRELYSFGQGEAYLLDALRRPYEDSTVVSDYTVRFGEGFTTADLHAFIAKLDAWGLLTHVEATLPSGAQSTLGVTPETDTSPPSSAGGEQGNERGHRDGDEPKNSYKNHWSLFYPEPLLDRLVAWFGFGRHFVSLLPLLFVLAVIGSVIKRHLLMVDLRVISINLNLLEHVLFTLFTTNLATQLLKGAVARHFTLATPSFGLSLIFGLLPRFNIRIEVPPETPKRARLWVAGAPVIARLILFPLGFTLWLATRTQGTALPFFGLALALISMISLLFVINPLMGNAGYRFLSDYYDNPRLREKAFRALRYRFSPPPGVVAQYVEDSRPLRVYALASIAFSVALIGFITTAAAAWLEFNYGGLGVAVTLLLLLYLWVRFRERISPKGRRRPTSPSKHEEPSHNAARPLASGAQAGGPSLLQRVRYMPWGRYGMLCLLTGALFLPYRYESGGAAQVVPMKEQEIYAEHPGLIEHVYYDGGEWVEWGTVIARMTSVKQRRDVAVTEAQIQKKQEELQVLLTTPTPQELALAEEALRKAQVQLKYSSARAERQKKLYESQSVSFETLQNALERMDVDYQEVREKEASLAMIRSRVNPHQIEALKAELKALSNDLVYFKELLRRTELTMPFDGTITTMHLKNRENKYLGDGELFAKVEDSSRATIEIEIPEADIDVISAGNRVRLKLVAFPNQVFEGQVSSIYPSSTQVSYGVVVKVTSVMDNRAGLLKSGMTGYAKVDGREMFVAEAFSRALTRFFQVEVWSWLP